MADNNDSSIITFRKQPCFTNIDYREKLSLCAKEMTELKELCTNVNDKDEIAACIVVIVAIFTFLKQKSITVDD